MVASAKRAPDRRTASQLVASGEVTRRQVYAATLALARLHDRGVAFSLSLEDMCEVLGYVRPGRRPARMRASRGCRE
ncbi:MAG: hypothetical protein WC273_08440 [Dehalococcoidia bacterium]